MRTFRIFLLSVLTMFAASCSLEMQLSINKDYSGDMTVLIDMSQLYGFMEAFDTIPEEQMDSMILAETGIGHRLNDSVLQAMAQRGITGLNEYITDRKYALAYHFDHIDHVYDGMALLDSSGSVDPDEDQAFNKFVISDNSLTIGFVDDGIKEMMNDEMNAANDDSTSMDIDISGMFNMFTIRASYEFEREIKDVDDNGLPVMWKGNRIWIMTNLTEFTEKFAGKEIKVVFK